MIPLPVCEGIVSVELALPKDHRIDGLTAFGCVLQHGLRVVDPSAQLILQLVIALLFNGIVCMHLFALGVVHNNIARVH